MKVLAGLSPRDAAAAAGRPRRFRWAAASPTSATPSSSRTGSRPTRSRPRRGAPFRWLLRRAARARLLRGAARATGRAPRSSPRRLVAFDPNFVAHAGVVHTDLARCAGVPGDRARVGPRAGASRRAGPAGRWRRSRSALALATKFSGVYLLPILAAAGAPRGAAVGEAGPRRARATSDGSRSSPRARWSSSSPSTRPSRPRMDRADQRQIIWEMVGGARRAGARRARSRGSPTISPPLGALPRRPRLRRAPERGGRRHQFPRRARPRSRASRAISSSPSS